ncbi:hypothetical protein G9A89_022635 [Geosiphon pyriformis]|nr:hypothetical protein G9A89_022635 [Geosiphon pyriformis]
MADNASMFLNEFVATKQFSDLDAIWDTVCKTIVLSTEGMFRKKWFKGFNSVFNKVSSRQAVERRMESFEVDKGYIIRSILECFFCKVVLDHLVVGEELVLKPKLSGLILFLAVGAFVDNMIWIGSSQAATQYILDIASEFFSFDCLSRPSLAKAHLDVWFFINFVLKKTILDKQFAYLVSSVLFPIVGYRTQFSFVPVSVCNKWDALIHKGLKSKSGLLFNFPNDALYYPSLYNLKIFEQIQAESKLVSVVAFANSADVLGHLFSHRSYNLQVLSWRPCHPLLFPVHVSISLSNNFLADAVRIFFGCNLSLGGSLADAFCLRGGTPMSCVLGEKHWKKLDPYGPVPFWFDLSLCNLGTVDMKAGAAVFFEDINSVNLFSNSQTALDAYRLESLLKNLDVNWIKVKDYLGILDNKCANVLVKNATFSAWCLPHLVSERFLKASGAVVSGNSRHFVRDVFCRHTVSLQTYFMKTFYHWLPVAMQKYLYDRCYANVVCLFCGNIEVSDHIFSCSFDAAGHVQLFVVYALAWKARSGLVQASSCVF